MDNEKWKAIERPYHAAAEINSDEQAEFLQKACDGDTALLTGRILATSRRIAWQFGRQKTAICRVSSPHNSGNRHPYRSYKIKSPLGEGGMGIVYGAHDTKLERDVAIKTLPDAFTSDLDRLERLQREAQVAGL